VIRASWWVLWITDLNQGSRTLPTEPIPAGGGFRRNTDALVGGEKGHESTGPMKRQRP